MILNDRLTMTGTITITLATFLEKMVTLLLMTALMLEVFGILTSTTTVIYAILATTILGTTIWAKYTD
jgi:hypothetical protein